MRVSIIKENKIQNIILPESIEGSFWIADTDSNGIERNLMSIEAGGDHWDLISNKKVYCIENDIIQSKTNLQYGHFYSIKNDMEQTNFLLYCSPTTTQYNYYDVTNILDTGLIIGSNAGAFVKYPLLQDYPCVLKRENNKVYVIDNNCADGIYVNDARIRNYKEIKSGDVIFILGLKIMYIFLEDVNGNIIDYLGVNNLNSDNILVNQMPVALRTPLASSFDDIEEEVEYPIYDEKEYFYKIPRFVKTIEKLEMNIDAPPAKQSESTTPLFLTMGPMITMSMMSVMSFYNVINGINSGQRTVSQSVPQLITSGAMILSVLLWPNLTRLYEKRRKKKYEKERQEKYSAYIDEKRQEIIKAKKEQSEILLKGNPPIEDVVGFILNKDLALWQRRLQDPDYLQVNLGLGTYDMQIDINYPEEHFTMTEDNLKKIVETLGSEPKLLENVPLVYSFIKHFVGGVIGNKEVTAEYVRRIILQLLAFQSYDNLKIVVMTDNENEYKWQFLKTVPHNFSNDKDIRFFATNIDENKELSYYLDKVFAYNSEFANEGTDVEKFKQTYIVVTDCFKKIRDLDFIKNILESKYYCGFSLLIVDNKMTHLPDQCSVYMDINEELGDYYDNEDFKEVIKFKVNIKGDINYEDCIYNLANIPIEIENVTEGNIPTKLGFLEMYGVGKIEQLNILNRWKLNDPTKSLRAPLGLDKQESIIYLDLHEKYHGPHGLIAGTTGSGKSETIITYILSMAANYSPNEVAFILIDYKGGGLAGAFENKKNNIRLPHLAGTITNLDKNEMNRTLVSIQSELTRRQTVFNEARDNLGESTIDIYKYQRFFREGKLTEPMPHLFIISDEFAELKAQQPEFMENLISAARIGRSLGVHLILATQKPSGVVNDQIWSNTKFRVCLKVATAADSSEMLKCPDAASIKNAGRFYLQVGSNEIFVLGQSGYCGTPYVPSDIVKKEYDRSINFIDTLGNVIKSMDKEVEVVNQKEDLGDELSNMLKHITASAKKLGVKANNLWLDAIPAEIMLDDVINKYNFKSDMVTAVIGEYDDPSSQKQGILTLPINQDANTMVYGLSGNNREMFLRTFMYSICKNYSSDDINFYIFDFGSESFRIFSKLPHVGDIVFASEPDKVDKLIKMINGEVLERKKDFADYNGDYYNYIKNSGNKVPKIIIVINNYESFKEMYSAYDEILTMIAREGARYGIHFIISNSNTSGIISRFLKNFPNAYVLDMNSKDEYVGILGKIGNVYPADFQGRGLFKKELAYEYQVAKICDEDSIIEFIKNEGLDLAKTNSKAKGVPVLPDVVKFDLLKDENIDLKTMPIGMEKDSLDIYKYNFKADKGAIISANEISSCKGFIKSLLKAFNKMNNIVTVLVDLKGEAEDIKSYANSYCNKDFDDFFDKILKYYEEKIKDSDFNVLFFLIGAEKFGETINKENQKRLIDFVKQNNNCLNILIDDAASFKKVAFDAWYKDLVNNQNGIWIGNGASSQSVIKTSEYGKKFNIKIKNDFAWLFKNGEGILVKLISEEENIPLNEE